MTTAQVPAGKDATMIASDFRREALQLYTLANAYIRVARELDGAKLTSALPPLGEGTS
jgi:hypothetical protein